jgi:uncharacterized lipoprotein YmbA
VKPATFAILLLVTILGAACGTTPNPTFYTLYSSVAGAPATISAPGSSYRVVIGPVTLPETVDRPQLVVRVAPNRVAILEQHRWAEPLKSELPRVMAEQLSILLGTPWVSAYPQRVGEGAEHRVLVDVQRFDSAPGEGVTIELLWTIRRASGGEPKTGRSLVSEQVTELGYDALVAAHGRALAGVCRDIARTLRADMMSP